MSVYCIKIPWEYPMQEKCSDSPTDNQNYKEFPWFLLVPFNF